MLNSWTIEYFLRDLSWHVEHFLRGLMRRPQFVQRRVDESSLVRKPGDINRYKTPYPGIGCTTFLLELSEPYYRRGDILTVGEFRVIVEAEPAPIGNMYSYPVQLGTSDVNAYLPEEYLTAPWALLGSTAHWPILD